MNTKQVQRAAELRGLYFDGIKAWRNSMIGYGYEMYIGGRFVQADTLDGIYRRIMEFPPLPRCSKCGAIINDDPVIIGGRALCYECACETHVECDRCGRWVPPDDAQAFVGNWGEWLICGSCVEEFNPPLCPLYGEESPFATPDCCADCQVWACANHL